MDLELSKILREIELALLDIDSRELEAFVSEIVSAKRIVTFGAGRVGLAMRGFAKRLKHLGLESYFLEDAVVPAIGANDLLIIGSNSGRTASVVTVAEIARENRITIISITSNSDSLVASLSKAKILMDQSPIKRLGVNDASIQPMTTLFEQCLQILLDGLVLELMRVLQESDQTMKLRHNVLE